MAMAEARPPSLILASGSVFRRRMLEAAGVPFEVVPADIDERALEQGLRSGRAPADATAVAAALARAKAESISRLHPSALVIGCDQVLGLEGEILSKAPDTGAARQQLLRLRGKTHTLHTAICLARAGEVTWEHMALPRLTMRVFSDAFLAAYADRMGARLCQTVGAYEIEGEGIQLFERIDGDVFSIVGLPLLPLLVELRRQCVVAS
jgi:septum formation protein